MARSKFRSILIAAFIAVAACASPSVVHAQEKAAVVDTTGLPADKIKQIQDIVESGKTVTQQVVEVVDPGRISEYAELGKAIGSSVAEAAKAIGVAAKDFSDTWMGKVAIFMIVWKLMLGDIVSGASDIIIGGVWITAAVVIWNRYFRKICLVESTTTETYERKRQDANGNYVKDPETGEVEMEKVTSVVVKGLDIQDGPVATYRLFMFIALAIMVIPGIVFLA